MKKNLLAIAIVCAGAVIYGAYQQAAPFSGSSNVDSLIEAIPADSALVGFQTEAYDPALYLRANGYAQLNVEQSIRDLQQEQADLLLNYEEGELYEPDNMEFTPVQQLLINFIDGYLQSAKSAQAMARYMGTPEKIAPIFYTLGLIPVFKVQLEHPENFWKTLDAQEKSVAGVTHTMRSLEGVKYRLYELTEAENGVKLVVSVSKDKVLTITLDAPMLGRENPLKLALGLEEPQASLVDSGKIADLRATYGKENNAFVYLDNAELVKGFTSTDGNLLARQIETLRQKNSASDNVRALHSASCQTELAAFAANWPREVMATHYQVNGQTVSMQGRLAIESNNSVLMNALQSIQGFIPAMASDSDSIFTGAIGLSSEQLVPAISAIWNDLQQPQYTCAPLAKMQQSFVDENLVNTIGTVAGALNGLEGLSVNLIDAAPSSNSGMGETFEQLNSVMAISSAQDPLSIIKSVGLFLDPRLMNLQLEAGGEAVDVTELIAPYLSEDAQVKVYAKMSEHHLAVYTGDKGKAAADKLLAEPLNSDGLVTFSMDTDRLNAIVQADDSTGELELLSQPSGTTTFNINDNGIALDFDYKTTLKAAN